MTFDTQICSVDQVCLEVTSSNLRVNVTGPKLTHKHKVYMIRITSRMRDCPIQQFLLRIARACSQPGCVLAISSSATVQQVA